MNKTINFGIMASGRIAEKFAEAVNYAKGANLYAIASRTKEKAEDFAKRHNAGKAYGSYEELAADENVDIVYIATPMSCHYDNVKLCFENGRNVICEKTLTLNASQLEELMEIAKEKKLFFMEAMWMKCMPHFRKALEWHKAGKIGKIKAIRADFSKACEYDPDDRNFRNDLGGGAALDFLVYPLSLITAFLGFEPEKIMSAACISEKGNVDIDETVILQYKNAYASTGTGFIMESENRAVIEGETGRIAFNPWFFCTDTVSLYDGGGKLLEEFTAPHLCNGYEYEVTEACESLNEGLLESRMIPMSETLNVLKLIDECRKQWNFKFEGE